MSEQVTGYTETELLGDYEVPMDAPTLVEIEALGSYDPPMDAPSLIETEVPGDYEVPMDAPSLIEIEVPGDYEIPMDAPSLIEIEVLGGYEAPAPSQDVTAPTHSIIQLFGQVAVPDQDVQSPTHLSTQIFGVGRFSQDAYAFSHVHAQDLGAANYSTDTYAPVHVSVQDTGTARFSQSAIAGTFNSIQDFGSVETGKDVQSAVHSSAQVFGGVVEEHGQVSATHWSVGVCGAALPDQSQQAQIHGSVTVFGGGVPDQSQEAGTKQSVQIFPAAFHYSTLNQIAGVHSNHSDLGSANGIADAFCPAYSSGRVFGNSLFGSVLPTNQNSAHAVIAGFRSGVPHTASILYLVTIEGGETIPSTAIYIRQKVGAVTSIEIRAIGTITTAGWAVDIIGKTISVEIAAYTVDMDLIAKQLAVSAVVTDLTAASSGLTLFAEGSTPDVVNSKVEVANVLYLQERSSGRRTVRCPIEWGVQAGDTIACDGIRDLKSDTIYMSIDRKRRIMEATEAA